ncbi:MAG: type IV secretory system conjugative DNA transfer family protein [Patescibacteria group bacterium]
MLPPPATGDPVTYFAQTDSRGKRVPFGIKSPDRSRHLYVIGKTGMGKSTLLENMAIQDIRNGNGVAFIDPHGKTAELLLDYIPPERAADVLYFAPFDMAYPIAFNIMEDVGADRRHLVVNGLMATFEKIWVDAWSARMAYILQNTLLALLEYPGSTLLGVNRMLVDKEYRKLVVANITDPSVRSFWVDEFAKYTDRYTQEATPAIQNKVGQFTANPLIRNIVGQPKSTFDLRKMMDEKKILIMNLSKGKVGEGNANLLGSMLITKIYLAAMSRADATEQQMQKLPDFYLYVDEFQSFANKSFADILSEARKYKLNLTLAHQYIEQMEEEVRAAVFGNVGTMAVFRVGAFDAEVLEKEFAPAITAEDLVNLGIYQIYLKLMIDGVTSAPFSATTLAPIERPSVSLKERMIEFSRAAYARPRETVEQEIKDWHAPLLAGEKLARGHAPTFPPQGERRDARGSLREREPQREPSPPPRREGERTAAPPRVSSEIRSGEPARSAAALRADDSPRGFRAERRPPFPSALHPRPAEPLSPLSLASLRQGSKKDAPGGAHLTELRRALSDVLKDALPHPPQGRANEPSSSGEGVRALSPADLKREREATVPRSGGAGGEIPEEELRRLLGVAPPSERKGNAGGAPHSGAASA